MRIFVAGFQHETNTFAPTRADWAAFESGSTFPAFSHGAAMLERLGATSLPMGGFIREARRRGWTLLPSAWAGASPSAQVARDAFERIAEHIAGDAARGGFDAVYLDLHGAAVAEHVDDAEGELLQRLRAVIGPTMPLLASLDLHANVTRRMLQHASAMSAYRTYPHTDAADTGARCAALLAALWDRGRPWHTHAVRLPFLLPLNAQCTLLDPARGVYQRLGELDARNRVHLSFAMGFPAADFDECGPVVFGHGADAAAVHDTVQRVADELVELRPEWTQELLAPGAAVQRALALAEAADKPVVIADTQDNPGAGGDSDTMGMVRALLECRAERAATGLIVDGAAAKAAHEVGVGKTLNFALGGKSRIPGDSPLELPWTVEALHEGNFAATGPFYRGMKMRLGPSACLRYQGVRIVVATYKTQLADQAMYRYVGIEPTEQAILVNKSSVHFRADFTPIAEKILVAKAPGPMAADPADLPWRHLPRGIRLHPFGKPFA